LRVEGPGFKVQVSWFRVDGEGLRFWGMVWGLGSRVQSSVFRVPGSEFRVQGSGFRVQGSVFGCYGVG
jgi:hypothetical protein